MAQLVRTPARKAEDPGLNPDTGENFSLKLTTLIILSKTAYGPVCGTLSAVCGEERPSHNTVKGGIKMNKLFYFNNHSKKLPLHFNVSFK